MRSEPSSRSASLPSCAIDDVEAVAFQIAAHDVAHDGVVVGDQHSRHSSDVSRRGAATCADVMVSSRFIRLPARLDWPTVGHARLSGVTVVLPCLNEAASLPGVLAAMPDGYRALVVDNNSTDGTAEVARRHGAEVVAEPRPGYGSAVHAGVVAATTPIVAVHRRRRLAGSRASCLRWSASSTAAPTWPSGAAAPVRGLRWPWHARLGTAAVCWRLRTRYGLPVHDIAPMRVARRDALLALGVTDRRSGYPLELLVRAAQRAGAWSSATSRTARAPAASRRSAARCAGVSLRRWTSGGRSRDPRCVVLVVAKAPVPGQAKTRLAASVGDQAAADIAAAALLDTLDAVAAAPVAARVVALTGDLDAACRADEIRSRLADFTVVRAARRRLRRAAGQRARRRRRGRRRAAGAADRHGHPAGHRRTDRRMRAGTAAPPTRCSGMARGRRLVGARASPTPRWPTACARCRCRDPTPAL